MSMIFWGSLLPWGDKAHPNYYDIVSVVRYWV